MIEPRRKLSQPEPGGRRRLLLATILGPLAMVPATIVWQLGIARPSPRIGSTSAPPGASS